MNYNIDYTDKKILIPVVLGAALVLTLATQGFLFQDNSSLDPDSEFNRADIMFMSMMIIHHDQAIEMANMAPERTENENILELAENISTSQHSENHQMADWLREAGYDRPTRGHLMAGMATKAEMNELNQSRDQEFDLLFSELMIDHHLGGIQMAQMVIQNGRSEKVGDIAEQMVEAQQREVKLMRSWRNEWTTD